eukprot:TRINITY_DN93992_c0_g1_i1.p1 TRINITY_DN93992_c0_g1~~TRINITY_DN93992_c0_g1_i1.p1  ORF type:complete len:157 (-),score=35.59 TRINITY_DN93992_c0_g1_i1:112-582(-)
MADEETGEYHTADAGASKTFPQQAGALKKGGFVVIKDRPCKIVEISTSKTGKHGHAKAHIVAIDIFTSKKLEELCPTSHNMTVPFVNRVEYQLLDINDGFLSLLGGKDEAKEDLKVPEGELGEKLMKDFEAGKDLLVTTMCAMGEEQVCQVSEARD